MSKKRMRTSKGPLIKPDLKFRSLEEVEDDLIGKKGTPKRDAYEDELKAEIENETRKADDPTTASGVSEKAIPTTDKKYGEELAKAMTHVATTDSHIILGEGWDEETESAESFLNTVILAKHNKLFFVGWPIGYNAFLIHQLSKRQFIVNEGDTKYLRIAVRFAKDRSLKDTLLVFDRRK